MKITQLQIERFGIWQDLSLPLSDSGLNVFYGPNEAGKTTLMRYLRGILYGFEPLTPGPRDREIRRVDWKGSVRIRHRGTEYEIARIANRQTRGLVSVTGLDEVSGEQLLAEILSETGEDLFSNVFAIGLHELQELAILNDDQIAKRLYCLTLGPQARRLIDVSSEIEDQLKRIFNPDDGTGRLAELLSRDEQLAAEIHAIDDPRDRHSAMIRDRDSLEAQVAALKAEQADWNAQIRGHRFLSRVWKPWNKARQIRAELDKIQVLTGFPDNGLARLDKLDAEIDSVAQGRATLLAEAEQFRNEAAGLDFDRSLRKHKLTVQSLIDQRDWLAKATEKRAAAEVLVNVLQTQLDEKLGSFGDGWSRQRLDAVDTSPTAQCRLLEATRNYQTALDRQARIRRRCQGLSRDCQKRTAELNERLKPLADSSIDLAIQQSQQQLGELEELGRLKLRQTELQLRQAGINDQFVHCAECPSLPRWTSLMLGFFSLLGVIFALLGFYTGVMVNGIAGLMYAFVGTACGATAYALKTHVEGFTTEKRATLHDQLQEIEVQLGETGAAIDRLTRMDAGETNSNAVPTDPPAVGSDAVPNSRPEAELVRGAIRRLAELEHMAESKRSIQSRRRRLIELRGRIQRVQHEASAARKNWCETLKQLGLSETVRIDEALDTWQRVLQAGENKQLLQQASDELAGHRRMFDDFRQRVEHLAQQLGWEHGDAEHPSDLLDVWDEQLQSDRYRRKERRRLFSEAKRLRREAARYRQTIYVETRKRDALLVQAGSADRPEFEQRAGWIVRREELQDALLLANSELDAACQSNPDWAVVEEDLFDYNTTENEKDIERLNRQLEQAAGELELCFEHLGSLKQEIAVLADDRHSTRLRYDRASLEDQLKRTAEEWFAVQMADRAVATMRREFERTSQPRTLKAASRYLQQLTRGRYRNIWTPLGQQRLQVDDEQGRVSGIEQLSGGTREQLFLAVRLALVDEFARQGVELPMVLDDVFVNFDRQRTEAAVDTLLQFAAGGQQILLFTCHVHLAQLFQERGVEPIHLPTHDLLVEQRKAG